MEFICDLEFVLCALSKRMEKGYIATLTVLIVMAVVMVTAATVTFLSIGEAQSGFSLFKGEDTLTFVEGCTEDALLKARASSTFGDPPDGTTVITITRPEGSCKIKVVSKTGPWTMRIQTDTTVTKYNRIIEVGFTRSGAGITSPITWKEVTTF